MRKIKEILRLKLDAKLPHERVAQSLAMSCPTMDASTKSCAAKASR